MSNSILKQDKRLNPTHAEYLQTMGIQPWIVRAHSVQDEGVTETEVSKPAVVAEASVVESRSIDNDGPINESERVSIDQTLALAGSVIDVSQLDWVELKSAVASCVSCALHETRTNTVFGVGSHEADIMVIGEAPGADEDQQGEPFVGRAGKLLDNMLMAIGYKREQIYIANILKCRPPANRDPEPDEIAHCEGYLKRQLELIKPKVILAVGRIAAHNLMKVETPIGKMRGKLHHYEETPVVVTYHPAYLLRKSSEKSKAWDDLQFALRVIDSE